MAKTLRLRGSKIPAMREVLLEKQGWKCPICGKPLTQLLKELTGRNDACLDHCHSTGMIRGVICRNCNSMEGKIRNCIRRAKYMLTEDAWLDSLRAYWKHYKMNPTNILHPSHKTLDEKRELRNKRARRKRKQGKRKRK